MNDNATGKAPAPWHLWVVGVLTLLWNCGGAYDYIMSETRNADYLAMVGADSGEIVAWLDAMPVWAVGAWAFGVWGSLLGSVLLLLRSRYAVWAFALSLAGAVISFAYQFTSDVPATLDTSLNNVVSVVIVALIAVQLWYANRMKGKGVIG